MFSLMNFELGQQARLITLTVSTFGLSQPFFWHLVMLAGDQRMMQNGSNAQQQITLFLSAPELLDHHGK